VLTAVNLFPRKGKTDKFNYEDNTACKKKEEDA
jgi:hypothetical protein